jgi:hypothetical protein
MQTPLVPKVLFPNWIELVSEHSKKIKVTKHLNVKHMLKESLVV